MHGTLRLLAILALLTVPTSASRMAPEQNPWDDRIKALGIWEHGKNVLLFSVLTACETTDYLHPQLMVSSDSGQTWVKSGSDLYGKELKFIFDTGREVMIGSQEYIEGPTNSPSILVYRDVMDDWEEFSIYDGDADLQALAQDELHPNRFLAWVEHINLQDDEEGVEGPVYLHQSLDGGHTWKVVRKVKSVPTSAPHLRFFMELPMEHGRWRVAEPEQPRARVEHVDDTGQWRAVTNLPLSNQETCPNHQPVQETSPSTAGPQPSVDDAKGAAPVPSPSPAR